MFSILIAAISYGVSIYYYFSVGSLGHATLFVIIGGILHILAEIRGQAQVTSVSMDEDAVKAMLKGIREFDDRKETI